MDHNGLDHHGLMVDLVSSPQGRECYCGLEFDEVEAIGDAISCIIECTLIGVHMKIRVMWHQHGGVTFWVSIYVQDHFQRLLATNGV